MYAWLLDEKAFKLQNIRYLDMNFCYEPPPPHLVSLRVLQHGAVPTDRQPAGLAPEVDARRV